MTWTLRFSSVFATPTSYPSCSALAVASSTFSNFFFRAPICSLAKVSWSSVWRNYWHWLFACLSAPSRAASTLFLSLFASVNLVLRSLILCSASVNSSMAAICRPSSSFIYLWESLTNSSVMCVAWITIKKKKKVRGNNMNTKYKGWEGVGGKLGLDGHLWHRSSNVRLEELEQTCFGLSL